MATQKTIQGVLVHRTPATPGHHKFRFHFDHYPIPAASLQPGTFSPPLPFVRPMLPTGLCVLNTHVAAATTTTHPPRDFASFFFGYWSSNLRQCPALTARMVFFREDLRPLHTRQCAVLWAFCEHVVRAIYGEVLVRFPWPAGTVGEGEGEGGGEGEVVRCMQRLWEERAGVDCFYAWGGWYRNGKLLRGKEEWREVKMLHDEAGPGRCCWD